jgi:hypothetical protein
MITLNSSTRLLAKINSLDYVHGINHILQTSKPPRKSSVAQSAERFRNALYDYLEGFSDVNSKWAPFLLDIGLTDKCPSVLYRLVLMPIKVKLKPGDTVRLNSKPLMSASDRPYNAVYAGSSYHADMETSLDNMQLALVSIQNPKCIFSFDTLKAFVKGTSAYDRIVYERLEKEREYIIRGLNVKGRIMYITDNVDYIRKGKYRSLKKFIKPDKE